MRETADHHSSKAHSISQSQFSDTPRTSILEPSETHPFPKSKLRHISFLTPSNKLGKSQSFQISHTRSSSSILTSPLKRSFTGTQELKSKETSLKKLSEKLTKITQDFANTRNTERSPVRESGFETNRVREFDTARTYEWETPRDSKFYMSSERSTAAVAISEDFEITECPTLRWCAYCSKETTTEVQYKNSSKTFLSSVAIFLVGGFLGCFLLPYVTNTCKDIKTMCHICKHEIAFHE